MTPLKIVATLTQHELTIGFFSKVVVLSENNDIVSLDRAGTKSDLTVNKRAELSKSADECR
jgi:hypothetical protein